MVLTLRLAQKFLRKSFPLNSSIRTIIDVPRMEPKDTIADIKIKLNKMLGVGKTYQTNRSVNEFVELNEMLPNSQDELPNRSMKDSYDVALIPLGSDVSLQDKYTATKGTVRIGRLLEDIDIFAVWIVMKHIKNPKQIEGKPSPYGIVTGKVDRIYISREFNSAKPNSDIRVAGYVTWVGKSSAEVVIWLEQENKGKWHSLCKAYFLMMARDRTNTRGVAINKIKPASLDEDKQLERAIARMEARKKEEKVSLLTTVPDSAEQNLIHNLFVSSIDPEDKTLSKRVLPPDSVWMADTRFSNYVFPHPEDRNIHQTIFGGFIMRMMLELAWMTALHHCKQRTKIVQISDVEFRRPIFIGSLVRMSGQVVYTEDEYIQVSTFSEIEDLHRNTSYTSNLMNYTLRASHPVKKVFPETYQEAVLMLSGRRHFEKAKEEEDD